MTSDSGGSATDGRRDDGDAGVTFERAFRIALWATAIGLMAAVGLVLATDLPMPIAGTFLRTQDVPHLAGQSVALLLVLAVPLRLRFCVLDRLSRRPALLSAGLAASALAIASLGCSLLLRRFDLVRDELDADFDAAIFRSGHLLAPLAPDWRPYLAGMRQSFVLPTPGDALWASNYLPVNAAWRAATGATIGALWANPLLLSTAVLALASIARRLFPESPHAVTVAVVCLVTSSQALVNAMTSYAMTGHLALNLVWLWLFLRNTRRTHALAAAVGFLACGLHQLAFHPLFVCPFILGLCFSGRWRLFAFYMVAYAVSGLFWTNYPSLALAVEGAAAPSSPSVGTFGFAARVLDLVAHADWTALPLMVANLLRFLAWENPIALVLVTLSLEAVRRGDGIARQLGAGFALTILLCAVVLPQQGNGFGYRYLHGLIGNGCLLAAYGWEASMRRATARQRRSAQAAFTALSAATILGFVPWTVIATERFEAPYRAAVAAIQATKADVILVDRLDLLNGGGLVRNDPFLGNRPVVLDLLFIREPDLKALCTKAKVAVFPQAHGLELGIPYLPVGGDWPEIRARRLAVLRSPECGGS